MAIFSRKLSSVLNDLGKGTQPSSAWLTRSSPAGRLDTGESHAFARSIKHPFHSCQLTALQVLLHPLCQRPREPYRRRHLIQGGIADGLQGAELAQEGPLPLGPDAWHRVQRRLHPRLGPHLAVVGDGESMGQGG